MLRIDPLFENDYAIVVVVHNVLLVADVVDGDSENPLCPFSYLIRTVVHVLIELVRALIFVTIKKALSPID